MNENPRKQNTFSEKVLERIEEERVTPTPKWHFLLKDSVFWCLWGVALFFGALSVSASIFVTMNAGWEYYSATHDNVATFIFDIAPLLWILSLAVFITLGYEIFKRTKRGYRVSFTFITLIGIVGSIFSGIGLYWYGAGEYMEEVVGVHIPLHRRVSMYQRELWLAPQKGFLVGKISLIEGSNDFLLTTEKEIEWRIVSDELTKRDFALLASSSVVRLIGVPVLGTSTVMHGCIVLPWKLGGFPTKNTFHTPPLPEKVRNGTTSKVSGLPQEHERNVLGERSSKCAGVRPYQLIQGIR